MQKCVAVWGTIFSLVQPESSHRDLPFSPCHVQQLSSVCSHLTASLTVTSIHLHTCSLFPHQFLLPLFSVSVALLPFYPHLPVFVPLLVCLYPVPDPYSSPVNLQMICHLCLTCCQFVTCLLACVFSDLICLFRLHFAANHSLKCLLFILFSLGVCIWVLFRLACRRTVTLDFCLLLHNF